MLDTYKVFTYVWLKLRKLMPSKTKETSLQIQNTVRIIEPDQEFEQLINALADREKTWADMYLQTLNKKRTSVALGSNPVSAAEHGVKMYNRPAVKAYIEYVIRQHIGEPDDSIKLLRTIQDTDLKLYMSPRQQIKRDYIEKPLKTILTELEQDLADEVDFETFYAATKKEITISLQKQKAINLEIIQLKTQMKKEGPTAVRILLGPEYLVTTMALDLNKIVADVEHGRIKKYKETKDGIEVEMYDSKDAAVELLKLSGSYVKDHTNINLNFDSADVKFE